MTIYVTRKHTHLHVHEVHINTRYTHTLTRTYRFHINLCQLLRKITMEKQIAQTYHYDPCIKKDSIFNVYTSM